MLWGSPTSAGEARSPCSSNGWQCWAPLFPAQQPSRSSQGETSPRNAASPQASVRPSPQAGGLSPAGSGSSPTASRLTPWRGPEPLVPLSEKVEAGGGCAREEELAGGFGKGVVLGVSAGCDAPGAGQEEKWPKEEAKCPEKLEGVHQGWLVRPRELYQLFRAEKAVGLLLGGFLFLLFLGVEVSEDFPMANDMLAVLGLVGSFWVFEVLPLPVTSLLPVVLLPFAEILSSKEASVAYWNWIQMLFVGAFLVDIAIERVNLHRRIALTILLKVGVRHAWVVQIAFACISYFMSMWCSNTATTVMLTPFATGLLDTARTNAAGDSADVRRYSVGILLTIAYSATCGGIATSIGTLPNGVLAGMPEVNGSVSAQDWMAFAFPVSFLGLIVANTVVYFFYVRGVTLSMDKGVLRNDYKALGKLNRDEVVVCSIQLLQIVGWLTRKSIINNGLGLKGVNDATIACGAAALLFFIPSVTRPNRGEPILHWHEAQDHLPWGVLLLMGGGFAIAKGFQASSLTRFVGEKLAVASSGSSIFGLTYLLTFVVCFLTEVTSNTATANIMLPIMGSVATETLTHPLALMLPTTVACSFAFMLPAATPPNSVVFATRRITIREFVKAGLVINLTMILLGAPLLFLMASAVYDTTGPFPEWACLPESCRWLNGEACMLQDLGDSCRLRSGSILLLNGTRPL